MPGHQVNSPKLSKYKRGKQYPVGIYLSKKTQEYENLRNSNNN